MERNQVVAGDDGFLPPYEFSGSVVSFTVLHAVREGFQTPLVIALVAVEKSIVKNDHTAILCEVVGVRPETITIGMQVRGSGGRVYECF